MYIIVGLGNPEKLYDNTRHNIGFDVIEELAKQNNIVLGDKKFKAIVGNGYIGGKKVVLAKPQTYMNLSGESVRPLVDFYKIDSSTELIIVSDDISLEVGKLRIRKKGSAGGHNGLKNIIQNLGSDQFNRVRMGVGEKPQGYDLADYVLGHFSKEDRATMNEGIDRAVKAIETIIVEDADKAMNLFN